MAFEILLFSGVGQRSRRAGFAPLAGRHNYRPW